MYRKSFVIILMVGLVVLSAGCTYAETEGDDYQDAPKEIQDGSLDYQDYQDANCPYLEDSLDQQTMEKCNEWIKSQGEV